MLPLARVCGRITVYINSIINLQRMAAKMDQKNG